MRTYGLAAGLALAMVLAGGCGGVDDDGAGTSQAPQVVGVSATELTVGQTLFVAGENFMAESEGRTELTFSGVYLRDDGVSEDVQLTIAPLWDGPLAKDGQLGSVPVAAGTEILRWSRFGPFAVPFTADGNRTGAFKGTVTARNISRSGEVVGQSEPTSLTLRVRPSIIIRRLEPFVGYDSKGQPFYANCSAPALRILQNLPYVLEVEAVGFEPEFFNYEFRGINGESKAPVKFSRPAKGSADRVGDPASGQLIVFNAVPENESFYWATIRVTSPVAGGDGDFIEVALPIGVHRPMEFHLADSKRRPAQYYEPVPVSGCIPGSLGNSVSYEESKSESRQKAVSVSISKSWNQSKEVSQTQDWSEGISESSSVSNSSSDCWSHSEAESAETAYGVSVDHSQSQSADFSTSDGESWGWSFNEGTSNSEMQSQTNEVFGEVSASATVEVSAEGSVPGFAKVGGKVGTTVGATVGGSTGTTVGTTSGVSTDKGASVGGSHSESSSFGSTTTDSTGESLSESYALSSQNEVGGSLSVTQASETSKVYTLGGSGGVSEGVAVGEQAAWDETWVTSETDSTLMAYSGKIPMGRFGVFYRQTVRYVREAQVYSYDMCGVRELMGNLVFNEWAWSPALAVGDECGGSVMPQSALPPAECVIPPCN